MSLVVAGLTKIRSCSRREVEARESFKTRRFARKIRSTPRNRSHTVYPGWAGGKIKKGRCVY
eukprot:scaffold365712_cov64-Attheya_sp.AAC.1